MKVRNKFCINESGPAGKCGRELYDDMHCIFHSKDIEGKKEKFVEAFREEFEKQDLEDKGFYFQEFLFPNDISFDSKDFKNSVFFNNATFAGDANFKRVKFSMEADFSGVTFSKVAVFNDATFSKEAIFNDVKFCDLSVFNRTTFTDTTHFNQAKFFGKVLADLPTFAGEVTFSGAIFSKNTLFNAANFSGKAIFNNKTEFLSDAGFFGTTFTGNADFNQVNFYKAAIFDQVKFIGSAKFRLVDFRGAARFDWAKFIGDANFHQVDFRGAAGFDCAKFNGDAKFDGVTFKDISKIHMTDTYFYDLHGLLEILEKNKIELGISETKTIFFSENIKIILGDKSAARYPIENRQINDARYLMSYKKKHPNWYRLWFWCSNCGRSFGKFACWSLGLVLLFALIYWPPPAFFPDCWIDVCNKIGPRFQQTIEVYKGEPLDLLSSIYFSIVTFTTLGFGDIIAANWMARVLVTIEVILGYVTLGGLISILANKVARRS